jgi:hypothetical protein
MMFLLVAPQCTQRPAAGLSTRRSASTRGITGFQVVSKSRFMAARSRRSTRARRAISRAAERGTSPSSASTVASAASTSSQRWIMARSLQIARMAGEP